MTSTSKLNKLLLIVWADGKLQDKILIHVIRPILHSKQLTPLLKWISSQFLATVITILFCYCAS